jgi:Na+/H+ antiporter NhaC
MVWIFMLAGSFAASAKDMGAAGAMVDLTLQFLPARFALAGLFIAACLTSLCMGTSVGTIVALMPIASGMAERTEMTVPMVVAAVVLGILILHIYQTVLWKMLSEKAMATP